MKIERSQNAIRNIIFGVILKVYQIVLPFVMRTAMIYILGVQYLGLNSLFVSILQVLNLVELGVGAAMTFNMYKPIAVDDTYRICAIMRLYKLYYRVIGFFIMIGGLLILPIIPRLILGEVPSDVNIYIIYVLNLGATVLSYWLFAYKNSLLIAHQRVDVISKITLVTDSIKYGFQMFLLLVVKNYYAYLIVTLVAQILTNIITSIVVDKMFPNYKPSGNLEKSEIKIVNKQVKDLFTSKIGAVILNSVDTIVISAFLGLTSLAVYQNYYYIITSVITFAGILFNACTAGIGNSIVVESKDKNYRDLNKFTFIINWISGVCTSCLLCLLQPFMYFWVGEELMLNMSAVVCFCIYYFIYTINQLLNLYKDSAGIWHEDRFRPLVTALANLGMNLIMVQFIGVYGVLLSTVFSMLFIGMPWIIYNLFSVLFKRKPWEYIKKLFHYTIITCIACVTTYMICSITPKYGILSFIVKIVICCIIPNLIFFISYMRCEEFKEVKHLVVNTIIRPLESKLVEMKEKRLLGKA
jgi:O-antigen/teichoic acid export membrane protein